MFVLIVSDRAYGPASREECEAYLVNLSKTDRDVSDARIIPVKSIIAAPAYQPAARPAPRQCTCVGRGVDTHCPLHGHIFRPKQRKDNYRG